MSRGFQPRETNGPERAALHASGHPQGFAVGCCRRRCTV